MPDEARTLRGGMKHLGFNVVFELLGKRSGGYAAGSALPFRHCTAVHPFDMHQTTEGSLGACLFQLRRGRARDTRRVS